MSDSFTPDGPQRLLSDLCRLVAERRKVEEESQTDLVSEGDTSEKDFQESQESSAEDFRAKKEATEAEFVAAREAVETKYKAEREGLEKAYESVRAEIEARHAADLQAAQQTLQDSHWEAIETSDAARGGLNMPMKDLLAGLDERWQQLQELLQQAVAIMQYRGFWDDLPPPEPTPVMVEGQPGRRFCNALDKAQAQARELAEQRLPGWFHGGWPLAIFCLLWIIAAVPSGFLLGWLDWLWAPVSCGAAALVGGIVGGWTYRIAKRRSVAGYLALRQTMLEAGLGNPAVLEAAKTDCRKMDAAIIARHKEQTKQADKQFAAANEKIERRRAEDLRRAESTYPKKLADLDAWREAALRKIEDKYPPLLARMEADYLANSERRRAEHVRAVEESRERFERRWSEMSERWREGLEQFRRTAEESFRASRESFPDWSNSEWEDWTPPTEIPPAIPLAHTTVKLSDLKGGVPEDPRLRPNAPRTRCRWRCPFPAARCCC